MRETNKAWLAAVAAALLLGTLVGAVWARPTKSPQAADITRKVTLIGAEFSPTYDGIDYSATFGVYCTTGVCHFVAPVDFPTLNAVTVERIRLHVSDNNATQQATANLYRGKPAAGLAELLGYVSSPTGTSGDPQTYDSAAINKLVWPSQKAYISLSIMGTNINVQGITVEYHVGS